MFEREFEFFPTPMKIAVAMWGELGNPCCVLEPSAGKGDLLAPMERDGGGWRIPSIDVIECQPELQMILRWKGLNVVHSDFMSFHPCRNYDAIIMNPPFRHGVNHLLHAWEIMTDGKIVCLLNRDTISKQSTRQCEHLVRIIEEHGDVSELGECFLDAERRASVSVCMVVLEKKCERGEFGFFEEMATERENFSFDLSGGEGAELEKFDELESRARMHRKALDAYREFLHAKNKVMFFVKNSGVTLYQSSLLSSDVASDKRLYNNFVDLLTEACWSRVFEDTNICRFVTSGVRQEFEAFRDENKKVDFTVRNVESLLRTLGMSVTSIMEEALLRVFGELTRFDKKNTSYLDGWKTNDAWRVNRKVIIPNVVECCRYSGTPNFSYYSRDILDDLDRVLCSLDGKDYMGVRTARMAIQEAMKGGWGEEVESEFFGPIRYYKKGTVHLSFKDERLLSRFNQAAARGKKWLPGESGNR